MTAANPRRTADDQPHTSGSGTHPHSLPLTTSPAVPNPRPARCLVELLALTALTALRDDDPDTADEAHAALVRAVADGDAEGAAEILRAELEDPFAG